MFYQKKVSTLSLYISLLVALLSVVAVPPSQAAGPPQQGQAEWTIMLYSDADDEILEQDMLIDLLEAEIIGSSPDVNIVAQVDRHEAAFDGLEDWTGTRRYYLTTNNDFEVIGSEQLADLGEVNMADANVLIDFITWAAQSYPARKYALILSDHGAGWPGGFGDPDPGVEGPDKLAVLDLTGGFDGLFLMEIDDALAQARAAAGIDKFELVGFDACLMAELEVFTAIAPHARYAVASEETEPSLGWAYAAFLEQLVNNPSMSGAELSQTIVDTYINQDIITLMNPEAEDELGKDITLSAIDLSLIPSLNAALDDFVTSLSQLNQDSVAEARAYAQAYESVFDQNIPSPQIDLGHFAQLVEQANPEAAASAQALLAAIGQAVIAEKHGPDRAGSTGIAIHFPVPQLYGVANNFDYTIVAKRFSDETLWDEFLAFHSGGQRPNFGRQPDQPAAPSPAPPTELPLPAAPATADKPIQVTPLTLSAEVAGRDQPVLIQADVSGDRLSYVFSFIGRFLPREDVLLIEDMDYIFAQDSQDIGGVTYPLWPEGGFTVNFEWTPIVFAINDGQNSVRALFQPETYGDSPTYAVEGLYTLGDSGSTRFAKLLFSGGQLVSVFGFTGAQNNGAGAPWEITPKAGDTFTVLEQGFNLSEEAEDEDFSREGGTVTFGAETMTLEAVPAPSGNYVVGIIAEDFDGRSFEQYEGLFVVGDGAAVDGFAPYVNPELTFALLYPETWTVQEDLPNKAIFFADEATTGAVTIVAQKSYPEATTAGEADDMAIAEIMSQVERDGDLENLQMVTEEAEPYVLGAFDGKIFEFTYEQDGTPYYATLVAATPTQGVTYAMIIIVPDEFFEDTFEDIDAILVSFDVLISGLNREQIGPPPPDFGDIFFADDFSQADSGLVDDPDGQEWGRVYYADAGQYIIELESEPGAIYDYYLLDEDLPDDFLLQATASFAGAYDNAYGLAFRLAIGDEADEFYAFRISGDGFYTVDKFTQDEIITVIDWAFSSLINQAEETENILTVQGQGNSYILYINGRQVASFVDDELFGGSFGPIAENFDPETAAAFAFDDLVVGTPAQ